MKKYEVNIIEKLERKIETEAESPEEAANKVRRDWENSEIVLDADDFTDMQTEVKKIEPKKIKVVILEPRKIARVGEIGASLEDMQAVVGGLIEPVYCFDDPVCVVVNEEGKIDRLPLNRSLKDEAGTVFDIIAGTAFICSCAGENFGSLSEKELERYTEKFKYPEKFFRLNGDIQCVPYVPKIKTQER